MVLENQIVIESVLIQEVVDHLSTKEIEVVKLVDLIELQELILKQIDQTVVLVLQLEEIDQMHRVEALTADPITETDEVVHLDQVQDLNPQDRKQDLVRLEVVVDLQQDLEDQAEALLVVHDLLAEALKEVEEDKIILR